MKIISTIKPCFYCEHPIDLETDNYKEIETFKSVLHNEPKEYVHELCAAEAQREYERDEAMEDWMEYQSELSGQYGEFDYE